MTWHEHEHGHEHGHHEKHQGTRVTRGYYPTGHSAGGRPPTPRNPFPSFRARRKHVSEGLPCEGRRGGFLEESFVSLVPLALVKLPEQV